MSARSIRADRITRLPVKVLRACFQSCFCCGLWGVLATRPRVRRPRGRLAPGTLPPTCGRLYSSLQRWGETRSKNTSSQSAQRAATSQCVTLSRPVTGVSGADADSDGCHCGFVIKWQEAVWNSVPFLSSSFFLPISQRDTNTHTHTGWFLSPETTCIFEINGLPSSWWVG